MKTLVVAFGIVFLSEFAAAQTASPDFELVGDTAATFTFNGSGGLLNFNSVCAAEFPGSRMCTSEEVIGSIDPPEISAASWVRPVFVPSNDGLNSDISGVQSPTLGNLSCVGWNTPAPLAVGLVVAPSPPPGAPLAVNPGRISTSSCSLVRAVACCAPVGEKKDK